MHFYLARHFYCINPQFLRQLIPSPPLQAHPDCNEDADKEVELVKVQQAGVVHVQYIKHPVNLLTTQVGRTAHEHVELDVCRISVGHVSQENNL